MHSQQILRAAMPEPESKLIGEASTENSALAPAASATALLLREADAEPGAAAPYRDTRLDRLPMQLDVMVRARSLRVGDLLALVRGALVETTHEHSQDLPVRCGGALLMWSEFEVVEQRLAVRITRLA